VAVLGKSKSKGSVSKGPEGKVEDASPGKRTISNEIPDTGDGPKWSDRWRNLERLFLSATLVRTYTRGSVVKGIVVEKSKRQMDRCIGKP
jgi:hypothetical protein